MATRPAGPELLTPAEVAQMLRVDPKSVNRWAKAGRLEFTRTPGGHRRYYRAEVEKLLVPQRERPARITTRSGHDSR